MRQVPETWLDIYAGSTFKAAIACNLSDGNPVPFATDGDWAGRALIRTSYGGTLVTSFANGSSDPGVITFDDQGHVNLAMSSTVSAALAPTFDNAGRLLTTYIGDLEVWQTTTPTDRRRITNLKVRIYPEATT